MCILIQDGAKGMKTRLYNFCIGLDTKDAIYVSMYYHLCPSPSAPTYIRQWLDFVDKTKPSREDRGKRV